MKHRTDFVNGVETVGSKIRSMMVISSNPYSDKYPYELTDITKEQMITKFSTDFKLSEENATAIYEENESYLSGIGALVNAPLSEEIMADREQPTPATTIYYLLIKMVESKGAFNKEDVLAEFRVQFPDRRALLYYEVTKAVYMKIKSDDHW